jgi:glutathione S-transferase
MVLETISMSHYVEKVRWCMDRLGVDYEERASSGVLGVMFTGRTVPRLKFQSGIVESSIGNSAEILRFLWGEFAARLPEQAAFLEPDESRLALEKRLDRYGVDLQVWVYYHILSDRQLTLRLWGGEDPQVPAWQRAIMRPLFPVTAWFLQRTFGIDDDHYARAVRHVDEVLAGAETLLDQDGRSSLLGGSSLNYVDFAFAAMSGLWLRPDNYGGGMAADCMVPLENLPEAMQADIERWKVEYPAATAFIQRLYATERLR